MKPEFKIGDRVRYVRPVHEGGLVGLQGEVGTVAALFEMSARIKFDNEPGTFWCSKRSLAHVG